MNGLCLWQDGLNYDNVVLCFISTIKNPGSNSMKKTLLAATLLAGFSTVALAESNVTLYGLVDAGLSFTNFSYTNNAGVNAGSSQFGVRSGAEQSNRWGLKGEEDLGDGNAVVFRLEAGYKLGNGAAADSTRTFNKRSYFGWRNSTWGTVKFGRQTTTTYDWMGEVTDPFLIHGSQVSSTSTIGWAASTNDNMLTYETPEMNGFQGRVGYSFATGNQAYYQTTTAKGATTFLSDTGTAYNFNTQNNTTALTAGVRYSKGPLYLVATYEQYNPNQNVVGGLNNITAYVLGGYYDFNVVKVYADFAQQHNGLAGGGSTQALGVSTTDITDASASGNSTYNLIFAPGVSTNSYLLGLSAPVGANGLFRASWQMAQPNGTFSANSTTVSSANENVYSLGYDYNFSKRTNLYAFASYASNYTMVSGLNSTQFTVGLRHKF